MALLVWPVLWTLARTAGPAVALYDNVRTGFVAKDGLTSSGIVDSGEDANIVVPFGSDSFHLSLSGQCKACVKSACFTVDFCDE